MAQEIRKLTYRRVITKTDQETAEHILRGAVKREFKEEAVCEEPPVGGHQPNGGVRSIRKQFLGQVKTFRDAIGARYQIILDPNDRFTPWVIEHACALMNRTMVGEGGGGPI